MKIFPLDAINRRAFPFLSPPPSLSLSFEANKLLQLNVDNFRCKRRPVSGALLRALIVHGLCYLDRYLSYFLLSSASESERRGRGEGRGRKNR